MQGTASSDKEVGLGLLFGLLGLGGAFVLYTASVGGDKVLSGWGFAIAMIAAALAIAAVHIYG